MNKSEMDDIRNKIIDKLLHELGSTRNEMIDDALATFSLIARILNDRDYFTFTSAIKNYSAEYDFKFFDFFDKCSAELKKELHNKKCSCCKCN